MYVWMYVCLCAWMVVYVCMCASVFPVLCAGVCMCAFACFPFTLRGRLQTVYGLQLSFNAVSSFLLFYIYLSLSLSVLSSLFSLSSLLSLLSLSVSLLSIRPTALKGEHTDLHFVHPVPLKFGASAPSTKSPLRAGVARSICFLVFEAELSKSGGMDTSDSIDLLGLPPRA